MNIEKDNKILRRLLACLFLCVFSVCFVEVAQSAEFQPIGPIAISMGGAGIANPQGAYSVYFNPALLAKHQHSAEISLSAGAAFRERNFADTIEDLSDIDVDETIENFLATASPGASVPPDLQQDILTIQEDLTTLVEENGAQVMPTVSLGVQAGNFGFGVFGVSEATAYAVVDADHLAFIGEIDEAYYAYDPATGQYRLSSQAEYERSSIEYAMNNSLTYAQLTGLSYAEIPMGYAWRLTPGFGALDMGASVKVMPGRTYDMSIDVDTDFDDLEDEFKNADKNDVSWGIDLGMAFTPEAVSNTTFGIVMKNLNSPEFDTNKGNTLEVDPQVRVGMASDFFDQRLTFALDADVIANDTYISGIDSQFIGGGLNFHPFSWLSLRGGMMKNIRESADGTILTAGIGAGVKWIQMDVSGQYSLKNSEYDGDEIPRYARAQFSLVSKW